MGLQRATRSAVPRTTVTLDGTQSVRRRRWLTTALPSDDHQYGDGDIYPPRSPTRDTGSRAWSRFGDYAARHRPVDDPAQPGHHRPTELRVHHFFAVPLFVDLSPPEHRFPKAWNAPGRASKSSGEESGSTRTRASAAVVDSFWPPWFVLSAAWTPAVRRHGFIGTSWGSIPCPRSTRCPARPQDGDRRTRPRPAGVVATGIAFGVFGQRSAWRSRQRRHRRHAGLPRTGLLRLQPSTSPRAGAHPRHHRRRRLRTRQHR